MIKKFYIALFIGCVFAACREDKDIFIPDPLFPNVLVQSDVSGQLVGENNQPLNDAEIQLNGYATITDQNGFFSLEDVEINSRRAILNATASDHFVGSRAFVPYPNARTLIKIKLISRHPQFTFSGSAGGEIHLPEGMVVEFPADAIIDDMGNGYTGEVHLTIRQLSPNQEDFVEKMPGDLLGVNDNGKHLLLETFGGFVIDLTDAAQQPLHIVPGRKVHFEMPIPAALRTNAPSSVPIWFFEKNENLWKNKGTATRQNDHYVGEIGQLAFWNLAATYEKIAVKGILKNLAHKVLTNMPFSVNVPSGGNTGFGYSGTDGTFIIELPKNQVNELRINDDCGDIVYLNVLMSYEENALIGDINIENSSDFSAISATLLDCDGNLLSAGYAILEVENEHYLFVVKDGELQGYFNSCSTSTVTLMAFDPHLQKQSEPQQLEVSKNMNGGEIAVCH